MRGPFSTPITPLPGSFFHADPQLQRRVKRMEADRQPRPSPIVVMCGSFDAFADATYADVVAGKLDGQFLYILDTLRTWDEGGVWMLAYAR